MKNNLKIKVDIDKSKSNLNGECQIFIFLNATIDGKRIRKKIFSKYSIQPQFWDNNKAQVKNIVGADLVNSDISVTLMKLYKIKAKLDLENKIADPELVVKMFQNENFEKEQHDFFVFVKNHIAENGKDYQSYHLREIVTYSKILKMFAGDKLSFEEITPAFLDKYRYYLQHERGGQINGIYQKLTFVRKFVNLALKQEFTKNNPFLNYKIKTEKKDKSFLELDEIKKLQALYDSNTCTETMQTTLHYFLLSCYTGLRLGDIKTLNKKMIQNNSIVIKTDKRDKLVRIPLSNSVLKMIDLNRSDDKLYQNDLTIESSYITKILNNALELCKIDKKGITFHSSRHSFAINSLVLGIPFEVVSKILGHSDLKTTQIYAKVVDSLMNKEMDKWNNI